MIITTQVTEDYYLKAKPLFESVAKHWGPNFVLGCIGFYPEDYKGEFFVVKKEDVASYRPDYPKNRQGFVTMQNGEFAKYIECDDERVIVCVDADSIMQRPLSYHEQDEIYHLLETKDILSVYHANPCLQLSEVMKNLGCKLNSKGMLGLYGEGWEGKYEFTTSFLIARKRTFLELGEKYVELFPKIIETTDHHAGNQWLFNYLCREYKVGILPPTYQCADWYDTYDTYIAKGDLYVNDKLVLFNHTKFN